MQKLHSNDHWAPKMQTQEIQQTDNWSLQSDYLNNVSTVKLYLLKGGNRKKQIQMNSEQQEAGLAAKFISSF